MAAASSDAWLGALRTRIADSAEFKALASELYAGVRDSLRAEGLPSFSSLAISEQEVLVGRARGSLANTSVYAKCRDATWRALDAALDAEAEALLSRRLGTLGGARGSGPSTDGGLGAPGEESNKVKTILELASDSATKLLDRWPQQQDELLWLLNTELPPPLRRSVWALKLRAPAARAEYERKRSESVLATMSLRDGAVLQQCQTMLQKFAPELLKQLPMLKTCLSYADSLHPMPPPNTVWPQTASEAAGQAAAAKGLGGLGAQTATEPPVETFWGVPLLRIFLSSSSSGAGAADSFIEHFLALQALPKPLLSLPQVSTVALAKGAAAPPVASRLLQTADAPLAKHLSVCLPGGGIDALLLPYMQRLCVGLLSPDAVAFVWDVCLLAGWAQLQPALAAMLICMRDGLMAATDAAAVKAYVGQAAQQLTVSQLQLALEHHFMAEVRKSIGAPPPDQALSLTPGGYS